MNVASGSYEYEGFLGSKLNNLRSFELQSKISHSFKNKNEITFLRGDSWVDLG